MTPHGVPRSGVANRSFLAPPMTDFAPLSTARRWALRAAEKPPASLGRFELRKLLGRGAQATVWLALDPRLRREGAIKLLRPVRHQDPAVRQPRLPAA